MSRSAWMPLGTAAALLTAATLPASCTDESKTRHHITFEVLSDALYSHSEARGSAVINAFAQGTDVEIRLSGLQPSGSYVAHIHDQPCSHTPAGGGHWKKDPQGDDSPTNEVHIHFHAYADGTSHVSTHSGHRFDENMKSIVVHFNDVSDEHRMDGDRVLCGDIGRAAPEDI